MARKVFGLLDRNNNGVASAEEIQAIFQTWLDINRDGIIMPQEMYNATEELFGQFCEDVKADNQTLTGGISSSLTLEEKTYLEEALSFDNPNVEDNNRWDQSSQPNLGTDFDHRYKFFRVFDSNLDGKVTS